MERRKKVRTEQTIVPFTIRSVSVLLYQNGNFFLTPTVHVRISPEQILRKNVFVSIKTLYHLYIGYTS